VTQNDEVNTVMKNSDLWKGNVERNILTYFLLVKNTVPGIKHLSWSS